MNYLFHLLVHLFVLDINVSFLKTLFDQLNLFKAQDFLSIISPFVGSGLGTPTGGGPFESAIGNGLAGGSGKGGGQAGPTSVCF